MHILFLLQYAWRCKPFLVSEGLLLYFVVHLYKEGLKADMYHYKLFGSHEQIAQGLGNPHIKNMAQLEYVI